MTRLALKAEVAWVDGLGGRVVAVDLDRLDVAPRVISDSGAAIWRAVAEGASTETEVVSAVADAYAVETAMIESDVRAFLEELVQLDLVRRID